MNSQSTNKPYISVIANRIKSRPAIAKIASNLGWLFWDRVLRMGLGLVIASWTARSLGPSGYGLLNWTAAWSLFFCFLAVVGLDSIVVRDIIKFPEEKNSILGTAFILKLVSAVASILCSTLFLAVIRPHVGACPARELLPMVGVYSLSYVFQSFDTIDFWYQSQVASQYVVYARSTAFLIISLGKIWLIHIHAPVIYFLAATTFEAMLAAAGLYLSYIWNRHSLREWRFDPQWAKTLLSDSWPLIANAIAFSVMTRIDQILLGYMVGQTECGLYSAAIRIIEAFGFIPMVIRTVVTPLIVKVRLENEDLYYSRLCNLYRLMFISFLVIAGPMFFFAKPLVILFLGPKFLGTAKILPYLCLWLFFANFCVGRGVFIIAENMVKYVFVSTLVGSVINIVLNLLLIPHYRSIGSICAMMLSYLVSIFLLDLFYKPAQRNLRAMVTATLTPWQISLR